MSFIGAGIETIGSDVRLSQAHDFPDFAVQPNIGSAMQLGCDDRVVVGCFMFPRIINIR